MIAPVLSSKVLFDGEDAHKVHAALRELTDEDPQLGVTWDEELQELRVCLMGTVQLEALQATLRDRFGLEVGFGPGGILYRETITAPVLGIGHFEPLRHYAEAQFLLEPLPAGSGVVFGSCCHVDDLDLNWQRLALTNAMERAHCSALTVPADCIGRAMADLQQMSATFGTPAAAGAGYNVGWQDVPAHAHCSYDPARLTAWRPANASFFGS